MNDPLPASTASVDAASELRTEPEWTTDEILVTGCGYGGSLSLHHLQVAVDHRSDMEAKEYAMLFVVDVVATVVGIFVYLGLGGSF